MQHKVITVIKREYITRVKTKGFLASILLMPVMMFIVMVLPSFMMTLQHKSDEIKTFVVFDETGEIFSKMEAALDENPFFHHKGKRVYQLIEKPSDFNDNVEAKKQLNRQLEEKEIHGYIEIPQDVFERLRVNYYAKNITNFELQRAFRSVISQIVTNKRLEDKGYAAHEVRDLMRRIRFTEYAVTAETDAVEGEERTMVKLGLTYVLTFSLYLFTLLYGASVMRSVLEEKTTRIVEVIISSVKPHQLLLGKIIGVCLVCLTMFLIWGGCAILLLININPILGLFGIQELPLQFIEITDIIKSAGPSAFTYFLIYFVSGFFLFSTIYAVAGAICNSEEEAQQVATPLVMMLIIPFMLMFGLFRAPDATLTIVLSHIPLFSPLIMFMRISVLTPPLWEILLNIGVMIATILGAILVMGKIYKIGILMYGKRPTLSELWKWLHY
jgi:ABC-2 type transport system permease protein